MHDRLLIIVFPQQFLMNSEKKGIGRSDAA